MAKSDDILIRLNETFPVTDIMIHESRLLTVSIPRSKEPPEGDKNFNKIQSLEEFFNHFDNIPARDEKGHIYGVFSKDKGYRKVFNEIVISASTGIGELFSLFTQNPYYFINHRNNLIGFVHFSDLNDPIVPLPIYAQIDATEKAIRHFLRNEYVKASKKRTSSGNFPTAMEFIKDISTRIRKSGGEPIDTGALVKRHSQLVRNNAHLDVFSSLYFHEALKLYYMLSGGSYSASVFGKIPDMNKFRRDIMHNRDYLIEEYSDVGNWTQFLFECSKIASSII